VHALICPHSCKQVCALLLRAKTTSECEAVRLDHLASSNGSWLTARIRIFANPHMAEVRSAILAFCRRQWLFA
jgi:hypothetical protein